MDNKNIIVSLNLNIDDLNLVLTCMSKTGEVIENLRQRIFNEGSRQIERFNQYTNQQSIVEAPIEVLETEEGEKN